MFLLGCQADPCERLCDRLGNRLDECMADWPIGWEELDARSRADFQATCREDWRALRSELEPWQLDDAAAQCEASLVELRRLRREDELCDTLRAIYLP